MDKYFVVFSFFFFTVFASLMLPVNSSAQGHPVEHNEQSHDLHKKDHTDNHAEEEGFNTAATAFHHISDQNIFNIGPFHIPLPCILYAPGKGLSVFSSSKFDIGSHGIGHNAVDGYVLYEGSVRRIVDPDFPQGLVKLDGEHPFDLQKVQINGKEKEQVAVLYNNKNYNTLAKSTLDGGVMGGGITNFYDFSITKNVVSMILMCLFLAWIFIKIARMYKIRRGKEPRGIQSFMEPIFLFIQEEVSKPFLGDKWEKYQPFLMALFFFILSLNLFGQIPFLGGANVTGNISVTLVLALIVFIVTNLNGKKAYWKHIFWMPGVPALLKIFILTPVEIMGMFIKPLTLMLRLGANIIAGHMTIIAFVGLIFIFRHQFGGAVGTGVGFGMSVPLTMFMMAIELLVAFIQAFVFTILTASYIGAAIEEEHH